VNKVERTTPERVSDGIPCLLFGVSSVIAVLAIVEVWFRVRGRRAR